MRFQGVVVGVVQTVRRKMIFQQFRQFNEGAFQQTAYKISCRHKLIVMWCGRGQQPWILNAMKGFCTSEQLCRPQLTHPSTVLCKSNANDNRRISHFVLAIYRRYISETSHGLPNVKTINHRDIGTIFAISRRDIVLARLRCNDISQSKWYITTIYRCSEVRWNDVS